MTTITTTPNADLMSRLARAGFSISKKEADVARATGILQTAEGNARVVLHEAIEDGRLSKAYATAFDSGYVAAVLGYGEKDAGLAKGARVMGLADKKRTDVQRKAVAAARAARSRLCKKLDIKAASDAGRKRGTKMSPPAGAQDKPAPSLAESQRNTSGTTAATPTIVNASEMVAWGEAQRAVWVTAQKKNGKAFTKEWRAVIAAMDAAIAASK